MNAPSETKMHERCMINVRSDLCVYIRIIKAAFHDTDTDILATILARLSAKMSVMVSWNAGLTAQIDCNVQRALNIQPAHLIHVTYID